MNGFGTAVVEHAAEHRFDTRLVTRLGLPDRFVKHASRPQQFVEVGLDAAGIAASVRKAIEEARTMVDGHPVIGTVPVRRAVPQLRV